MKCPYCKENRDKVIDSRSSEAGRMIRRRRQCLACKRRFTTYEKIGESFKHPISVVLPLEERVVIPSINRGRPFMLDDKSRPICRAMLSLAESVRQRLAELAEAESQEEKIVGGKVSRVVKR